MGALRRPRTLLAALLALVVAACQEEHRANQHNHRHHKHHQEEHHHNVALADGCPQLATPTPLRRNYLTNKTITCNDGTPAGYYIRKSHGSKRWVVFLEGGWYCFDARSCRQRWVRMRAFMTSRHWMESRHVGGIMSSDPQENPHWWNANHVFVPYCSSDTWSGAAFAAGANDFSFLGSLIIEEVFRELISQGILGARRVLLAGSSAGGTGVMLNVDRVAHLLRSWGSRAQLRAVADSGWFLDNEPYAPTDCTDWHSCAPLQAVKLAHRLWNGQVPAGCKQSQPAQEQWRCYFGYVMYKHISTPLFVFQWLFDEAQLTADNLGAPLTKAQWDYIHAFGDDLRRTLRNVSAAFAPSCISHTSLTKRDWRLIRANDVSLTEALHCWEMSAADRGSRGVPVTHGPSGNSSVAMLSDSPNSSTVSTSGGQQQPEVRRATPSSTGHGTRRRKKKKPQNRKRNRKAKGSWSRNGNSSSHRSARAVVPMDETLLSVGEQETKGTVETHSGGGCSLPLLDDCTWPQCNRACPKLINPFTGEEMDVVELLKSFGLDMGSVASALGIDVDTLNAMGNDRILQILTQHTR